MAYEPEHPGSMKAKIIQSKENRNIKSRLGTVAGPFASQESSNPQNVRKASKEAWRGDITVPAHGLQHTI